MSSNFDISSLPAPPKQGAFDISSLPAPPKQAASDGSSNPLWSAVKGAGEAVSQIGSGMVAAPVSDIAALGTIGKGLLTGTYTDPAAVKQHVQSALTYQPKTAAGKAISAVPNAIGGWINDAAEAVGKRVKSATGSDAAAAGVAEAVRQGIGLIGAKLPVKGAATVEAVNAEKTLALKQAEREYQPTADFIKQVTDAGYEVPPQGKLAEFLKDRNVSLKNERNATQKIAQQIGLSPGEPLTEANLAKARTPALAVRDKIIAQLPKDNLIPPKALVGEWKDTMNTIGAAMAHSPEINAHLKPALDLLKAQAGKALNPAQTLKDVQTLRDRAYRDLRRPELRASERATADAELWLANKYEQIIDANIPAGEIDKFRAARTRLAQIHDAESAIHPVTRQVDFARLARMSDKRPLSGALKDAALFAKTFKSAAKSGTTAKSPVSMLDVAISGGLAAAGHPGAAIAEPALRGGAEMLAPHISAKPPSFKLGTGRKLTPAALRALGVTAYGESKQ